jgi:ribosome modulation factor
MAMSGMRDLSIIATPPARLCDHEHSGGAHQRGYQAGIAGRSKEMCPYQTLTQRSQWLGGWREAIGDRAVLA